MHHASVTISRDKKLFKKTVETELRVSLFPEEGESDNNLLSVARLLFAMLKAGGIDSLIQFESRQSSAQLTNLRGRPPESFTGKAGPAAGEEELLHISGKVVPLAETPQPPDLKQLAKNKNGDTFSFNVSSRFSTFSESGNIIHTAKKALAGPLAEIPAASSEDFLFLLPLWPQKLRFGVEVYERKFFGLSLGSAPKIVRRMYLEATNSSISLFASDDNVSGTSVLPFAENRELELVLAAFDDSSMAPGLLSSIQSRLAADTAANIQFEHTNLAPQSR